MRTCIISSLLIQSPTSVLFAKIKTLAPIKRLPRLHRQWQHAKEKNSLSLDSRSETLPLRATSQRARLGNRPCAFGRWYPPPRRERRFSQSSFSNRFAVFFVLLRPLFSSKFRTTHGLALAHSYGKRNNTPVNMFEKGRRGLKKPYRC